MKNKNLKLSICLGGIVCLIFALFLFYANFLMAQDEVGLTEFIDDDVGCVDSTATVDLRWTSALGGNPDYYILRKIEGDVDFIEIDDVNDISYTDNSIDSDKIYVYQIRAEKGSDTYYSNHATTTKKAHCPPILQSTSIQTSCKPDGPYIYLEWTPVSGGLKHYEIYRRNSSETEFPTLPFDTTTEIYYEDGPNIIGTETYFYYIKSVWQDDASAHYDSEYGEPILACSPTLENLSTSCLTDTDAAPGGPVISLSWNKLLGIQEYQIWRQTPDDTEFQPLDNGTITDEEITNFEDKLVESYPNGYYNTGAISYKVKAVWAATFKDSNIQEIDILKCPPFLSVTSDCKAFSMKLRWTATQSTIAYEIYRDGTKIDRNDGTTNTSYDDWLNLDICPEKKCDFNYYIKAIIGVTELIDSNTALGSIDCTTINPPEPAPALNEPTSSCDLGIFKIYLSWLPSNNLHHYTLYRDSTAGLSEYITGETAYTDSGVESSYDYTYSVTAFGENDTSISDGTEWPITAKDCSTPKISIFSLTPNCSEGNPLINISWSDAGSAATSYVIYRGFLESTLESIMAFDEETEIFALRNWDDASVDPSITYYYKVVAKGQDGTDSNGDPIQSESTVESAASYSCDPTVPDFTLSNACNGNQAEINVSWITDKANTTRYEIFRKDYSEINPIHTIDDISIKVWIDTPVSSETAYEYKVEAVGYSSSQRTTQGYKPITSYNCAPLGDFTLSDPTPPYCQGSYPRVDLSWTDSTNADFYDITRFNNTTAEETILSDKTSVFTDFGYGRALNFDGNNDYILVSDSSSLRITAYSAEAWVKPQVDNDFWTGIVGKPGRNFNIWLGRSNYSSGGYIHHRFRSTGGGWNDGCPDTPYGSIPMNKWSHIIITNDGDICRTYINGDEIVNDFVNGSLVINNTNLYIGRHLDGSNANYFEGQMDEVRVYSRALTFTEVQEHYQGIFNDESGLAGLWHFDEGSGSAVSDSSNNGNNGSLVNMEAGDWVENGLQTGENYNWQATAFGVGGEIDSNLTTPITLPDCPPTKPGLVLSMGCSGADVPTANLSWSYSYGATSFKIYREGAVNPIEIFTLSDPADPEFASRDWVDDNEGAGLIDETIYTYWVEAIGPGGQIESDHLPVTTYNCLAPTKPKNLTASFSCVGTGNSYPQISLTWDESTNTDYYTVYRKIPPASSSDVGRPETNSFTDSYSNGVEVDTHYEYFVTPTSLGGVVGINSDIVPISTDYCAPSTLAITSLTTACESGLPVNTIIWSDNTVFNTDHYEIYRNGIAETDKIASNIPVGTLNYIDNLSLVSSANYTYYIKAIGPTGLESPDFASESIDTYSCGIAPVPPTLNLEAGSPYCVDNIHYADLNWAGVDDAYSYNFYRTNPDNSVSTSSTAVSPFTDKGDYALDFDGSNDYISIPSSNSLNPERITMEAWVNPNSYSNNGNIIRKRYTEQYILRFYGTTGRVRGYVYVNGGWRACTSSIGATAGLNQWSHIVSTYDGNEIKVYVNGIESPPCSYAGIINSGSGDLRIGAYSASSERFKGMIDEVRIYGRALSSTEVKEHYDNIYKNETDLRGVWHFNEGNGSTVYDDSENSNNGSLKNMSEDSWKYPDSKPHFINPLQGNQTYKYKIKAIGVNTESAYSNEIAITTGDCFIKPTLGINDICTDRNNPITLLNWDYYTDVTDYEIYKDSSPFQQKTPANYISSNGFIKHWLLVGPFAYSGAAAAFNKDYIEGELDVRPRDGETVNKDTADEQTWFDYFSNSSYINFNNIFSPNNNVISYAFAYIYSPIEQNVKLWIGSDDGVKAFLNGDPVHSNYTWRSASPDQDEINITLSAGINTLLIKVQEGGGNWGFYARIKDSFGNNVLDHITTWDSSAETAVSADYYVKAKIINEEKDSIPAASNPLNCAPADPNLQVEAKCAVIGSDNKSIAELSWDEDPNTEYWSIYKRRQNDPPLVWSNIAKISSPTSYTDENVESGVIYEYYLTAFGKEQQTNSDIREEKALVCEPYPSEPTINLLERGCAEDYPIMNIGWTDTTNTIAYNVWRKNITTGAEYIKIKADLSFNTFFYKDLEGISDHPLTPKDTYRYMIEAVGSGISNSHYSVESNEITAYDCANMPPLAPLNFEIISTDAIGHFAYVRMGWIDSGNEDKYVILRDGIPIATLTQGVDYNLEDSIIYYNDNTVSDATTYIYVIRAVNNNPETTDSNAVTADIPIARPGEFTLSISWVKDTEEALLSWTEAASTTSGGIVSYRVLRDDTTDFTDVEEICAGIEAAPFECSDDSPTLLERYYSAEATNFGGTTNSNTVDIITVILPTWKEVKP